MMYLYTFTLYVYIKVLYYILFQDGVYYTYILLWCIVQTHIMLYLREILLQTAHGDEF